MDSKAALVTGAGRGIGRAIAVGLAEDGFDLVLTYRRDLEQAEDTARLVRQRGRSARVFHCDVSERSECLELIEQAFEAFPQLAAIVHNGGIASRGRSVADTDPDEPSRLFGVHALGPFWLTQAALPRLRLQPRADIVFISSAATKTNIANGGPYNMAKSAAEALASTLAKEERSSGIHVNVVAPGLVDTEMGRRLAAAVRAVSDINELASELPFGRVCAPEDVADAVRFLISSRSDYLTDQTLYVDGGGQQW